MAQQIIVRDLCMNKELCLSKALLGAVALDRNGLDVYKEYFIPFTLVSDEANLSCLRRIPDLEVKVRNTMYKIKEPKQDPAFFTFHSHHDVNRLATMLNAEIVIYLTDSIEKKTFIEPFHDFRHISLSQKKSRQTLYFLLTASKQLFKLPTPLDDDVVVEKIFFVQPHTGVEFALKAPFGLLGRMSQLLRKPQPNFEVGQVSQVTSLGEALYEFWRETIIIVSYCRNFFCQHEKNLNLRCLPAKAYFVTLAVVASREARLSVGGLNLTNEKPRIICLFANNKMCLLKKEFVDSIVDDLLSTSSRSDKPPLNDFLLHPKVSKAEREAAGFLKDKSRREKPTNRVSKHCTCELCLSTEFDKNMAKSGPEQLLKTEFEVGDLLEALGMLTQENKAIIEKMCEYSLASMDIESMTVNADLFSPQVNEESGLNYAELDKAKLEDHVKKVQKPIMIAHVDAVGYADPKKRIWFVIKDDSEADIYKMMRKYWRAVLRAQIRCSGVKRKLAAPIFDLIQEYKNAYFETCRLHFDNLMALSKLLPKIDGKDQVKICPSTLTLAWWQMLPGKLERGLDRLIRQYNIFSFYG